MWIWIRSDPHSIGSVNEIMGKVELTNKFLWFFCRKLYYLSLKLKERSLSLRLRYRFENIFSSSLLLDLDPDPHSPNFVDPDPINADPHHCIVYKYIFI